MKYFSLFSGIGGFELGIGKRGTCVGFSEIDKYAVQIYQEHFPNHKNYGDITLVRAYDLPDFDLLVGGFPCQSFSIAGKRKGFDDTRGTLFFDIARILKAKQPRRLLLENVKGLLSHDNGRTFKTIISTLDELGYDLQWQVLNSKNFRVPQNRERIFIIGHLRNTSRPEVFPFEGKIETTSSNVFVDESQWRREGKLREYQGISPTLNTVGGGGHLPLILQKGRGKNKGGLHEMSPTVSSSSFQDNNHLISKTVRSGGRASPHGSKQNWDSYEIEGTIRRLTPIECERLQSFPDNWTQIGHEFPTDEYDEKGEHKIIEKFGIKISDSQRYKCLGNAVTVNVIQAIIDKMI